MKGETMKTGWWRINFDLNIEGEDVTWGDLSDTTQQHILRQVESGYTEGEICEDNEEDDDIEN
jgi:hypothetical protein